MSVTCLIKPNLLDVANKIIFIEAALSGYSLSRVHALS